MNISRPIAVFCVYIILLLSAKTAVYRRGGELTIASDSIGYWLTNIPYLLWQDVIVFAILLGCRKAIKIRYPSQKRRYYLIIALYIALYIVDMWLYKIFLSRLAPSQYLAFLTSDTIMQFAVYTIVLLAGFVLGYLIRRSIHHILHTQRHRRWIAGSTAICAATILVLASLSPAKSDLYPYAQNFLLMQSRIRWSKASISSDKLYTDYSIIARGQNKQPNIIVLFAESRSAIDSIRAGGLYNHFPKFDLIQADGLTFTNFFAHGCTSDASHIAFLQGTEPRASTQAGGAYEKYRNYRGYLPVYFQQNGYNTQFFSTVSLDFLDQRSYLEKLGFNNIRGEEYFVDKPRYVFDAASDTHLYEKTIQQVQDTTDPFLFILQNVSGHHPYHTPYGRTFASAMRYSDDSFAAFYKKLQDADFFDNGYLIVFSDHRKIAPLTREEFQHFGRSAYNRGVATIIGPSIQPDTLSDTPYQHIDFYHGLKLLIADGGVALPSTTNDPFGTQTGRDRSVRYCQYQDPRYYITEADGTTAVWTDSPNIAARRYIAAYEKRHNQKQRPTQTPYSSLLENYGITLVAHQGSPVDHPANSVVAMRKAAEQGAKGVEFDVSRTTDGYHVVVHGPDMGSIQCQSIKKPYIYQYSFKELRADCTLSNGDAILTLSEMLEKLEGLFDYVFVDIKTYQPQKAQAQAKDIVAVLNQFDRKDRIHPIAYDKTVANYLLTHSDTITVGRDSFDFDLPELTDSPIASYLLGLQFITQENLSTIQAANIPVFAYTVRSYEEMETVLNAGITHILVSNISDAIQYIQQYHQQE